MSRKGDPWENAMAESLFPIVTSERVYHATWHDYDEVVSDLFVQTEIY